ncbi:protein YgfX [Shewanella goraebulensis]|uniref:protein YgfX n=1 Tax=Shewanella goraebulensis TaxID=3050637 RepID=UPI002DD656A9|nr:protein YgfX [Shewanella goraebulensis]
MHVSLSASFNQFLSHIVLICLCLTSFLLWPQVNALALTILYWLVIIAVVTFFSWHLIKLKHWHYDIYLSDIYEGKLNQQLFCFWREPIVTVFACMMFIELDSTSDKKKKVLLIVWSDMLSDKDYRQLCRLLIKLKNQ